MSEIELVKFIGMIISLIAIINFPFIIKRRKDFVKYIPGIFCIILQFIITSLDDIFNFPIVDLFETCLLIFGSLLLFLASLKEIHEISIRKKIFQINTINEKEE